MSEKKLALWKERHERIQKALNFEPVDRIPFSFLGTAYAPVSRGMPLSKFCTDPDAAEEVTIDCLDELDVDGINMTSAGLLHVLLTNLWLSRVRLPGKELPENTLWQIDETENMKVEDYDFVLEKGWEAFLAEILPKVHHPELLARNKQWLSEKFVDMPRRYQERGYDTMCCAVTQIPFEALCGARSMGKFFFDCYRMPKKVKAVLDIAHPYYIKQAINVANACGVKSVWVGGWRSASALVAPKIWNEFVFPYYLDMVTKLHENGIFCVLHFDQNWDRDIQRFLEFPRRSCAASFDGTTNIRRAKQILGDHMAFLGDVPSAMLATGTPEEVSNYVRELIRDLGPTGFIMKSGCDAPINSLRANIEAMVAATRDYGTFSGAAARP